MSYELDTKKLATMVRAQRANRPLREVADEISDVSASTLHRLEVGKCPDMAVFLRICSWLNVKPEQFFSHSDPTQTVQQIGQHYSQGQIINLVRSDSALSPVVANVLSAIITAAYEIDRT
ncbi:MULTISPECIES: helix-turn-helix transcriptional regulator [unclassified Spirosoma]|uniref:helix-turn-helix domain-containing protein n=1 Tax=unclassified Spirosoma TaxID=2621999 RepID=UPI000959D7BA|nr:MULTISPECIES: helix-turn-helix transcriptional regulator [unclassified Spirosoma]MBN8827061.1 helix-turn-helix transcriptional regulator [Spirosoma sp.]OJW71400.1 MAG: hypothetical protein BGO59_19990 [Spirosoma sp. 48-14]